MHDIKVTVMLRPTVSRPVYLGIEHPSGAQDQIFINCQALADLLIWGPISHERTGLSLTIAASPHQPDILSYESRGTYDHILLSQSLDCPNLEGQVPVHISPMNRVSQL
jgi:hypothetical protein